jgi:hypothetical protein
LDPETVSAYLTSFLDIVIRLERLGCGWINVGAAGGKEGQGGGEGGLAGVVGDGLSEAEIEERELVEWASLKECQVRFLRECGVGLAG